MKDAGNSSLFRKIVILLGAPVALVFATAMFVAERFALGHLAQTEQEAVRVLRIVGVVAVLLCILYYAAVSRLAARFFHQALEYIRACENQEYDYEAPKGLSGGVFGEFNLIMGKIFETMKTARFGLAPILESMEGRLQDVRRDLEPLTGAFQNQARSCRLCLDIVQEARNGTDMASSWVFTSLSHLQSMKEAMQEADSLLQNLKHSVHQLEKETRNAEELMKGREEIAMQTRILSILSNVSGQTQDLGEAEAVKMVVREIQALSEESAAAALAAKGHVDMIYASTFAGTEAMTGLLQTLETGMHHLQQAQSDMEQLDAQLRGQSALAEKAGDRLDVVSRDIAYSQETLQGLSQKSLDILHTMQEVNIAKEKLLWKIREQREAEEGIGL